MHSTLNPNLFKRVTTYYSDYKKSLDVGLKRAEVYLDTEIDGNIIKIQFTINREYLIEKINEGAVIKIENQFHLKDGAKLTKDDIYQMIIISHQTLMNHTPKGESDNIKTLFVAFPIPSRDEVQVEIDSVYDALNP